MEYSRNLKKGTSGEDVLFCKQKLLELGFYGEHITTVTRKTYGADTLEAVKRFQAQAGSPSTGSSGRKRGRRCSAIRRRVQHRSQRRRYRPRQKWSARLR